MAESAEVVNKEQNVNPWDVEGAVIDGIPQAIDYQKIVESFGSKLIDTPLLKRFEELTGQKPHRFLQRNIFFSHRDFEEILDRVEKKQPFYLYTGRGPSSESMHLGHLIPFVFCQWLQQVFKVPLVIQLTDDEKFLFKQLTMEQCHAFALENAKDIIAMGFDPELTFIFSNLDYVGGPFYWNICRISKLINCNQSKACFGFDDTTSVGKIHFACIQAAPSFCSSFPEIFGERMDVPCLIPCAIDQDPYFRLTRDVSKRLNHPKPSLIHSSFFPSLQGPHSKMSSSTPQSGLSPTIFLTDSAAHIKKKINKFGFSGGAATLEEHLLHGGNPDIDVAYMYLRFWLDDKDINTFLQQSETFKKVFTKQELEVPKEEITSEYFLDQLAAAYRKGKITSGEMKAICIECVQKVVADFQSSRSKITDEDVKFWMTPRSLSYMDAFGGKKKLEKQKEKKKKMPLEEQTKQLQLE